MRNILDNKIHKQTQLEIALKILKSHSEIDQKLKQMIQKECGLDVKMTEDQVKIEIDKFI